MPPGAPQAGAGLPPPAASTAPPPERTAPVDTVGTAAVVATPNAAPPVRLSALPVRTASPEKSEQNRPFRQVDQGSDATKVIAVPVRRPPAASERAEPLSATAGLAPLTPTPEGDFWFATVQTLVARELVAALVRELALQSQLVARDADQWLLRIERESLNQGNTRERLQNALAALEQPVRLAIEIGRVADSPARRIAHAQQARQREAEAAVLADPFVQQMMREFGAKIVPGSVKP